MSSHSAIGRACYRSRNLASSFLPLVTRPPPLKSAHYQGDPRLFCCHREGKKGRRRKGLRSEIKKECQTLHKKRWNVGWPVDMTRSKISTCTCFFATFSTPLVCISYWVLALSRRRAAVAAASEQVISFVSPRGHQGKKQFVTAGIFHFAVSRVVVIASMICGVGCVRLIEGRARLIAINPKPANVSDRRASAYPTGKLFIPSPALQN